jgi:FKBP-type peptidyl-prolyl cis-trans isomerase
LLSLFLEISLFFQKKIQTKAKVQKYTNKMSQEPKMTFFQPGDEKNYPQDGDRVEVQYKGFLQDGT